jgi:hypothetical protein
VPGRPSCLPPQRPAKARQPRSAGLASMQEDRPWPARNRSRSKRNS